MAASETHELQVPRLYEQASSSYSFLEAAYEHDDKLLSPSRGSTGTSFKPGLLSKLVRSAGWTLGFHVFIAVAYIVLIIIWAFGWEQHSISLSDSAHWQTYSNAIFHVFILVMSAIVVLTMQAAGVRSTFTRLPQPLTALSDQLQAWNGLGASLLAVYHNLLLPITLMPSLITAVYFLSISVLGFSSSFLFSVPNFNHTRLVNAGTTVGALSVQSFIPPASAFDSSSSSSSLPSNFENITFDWFRSSVGVGMLAGRTSLEYPGLFQNRIFDTISDTFSSVNATAVVNYTDFHVKCGQVAKTSAVNFTSRFTNNNQGFSMPDSGVPGYTLLNVAIWPTTVRIDYQLSASTSPTSMNDTWVRRFSTLVSSHPDPSLPYLPGDYTSALWLPSDVLVRIPPTQVTPGVGRNLVLYLIRSNDTSDPAGAQAVLDASGEPGPAISVPDAFSPAINSTAIQVQVVGCSLSTTSGNTEIDVSTNRLINPTTTLKRNNTSRWTDWEPDMTSSNKLEDTWASMFLPSSSVGLWFENEDTLSAVVGSEWSCSWLLTNFRSNGNVSNPADCHIPNVIEQYLSNQLFGTSAFNKSTDARAITSLQRNTSQANPTLAALENALSQATAMTMWSAARANTLTTFPTLTQESFLNTSLATRPEVQTGTAVVKIVELAARLQINGGVLFLGFAASVLLCAIATYVLLEEARYSNAQRSGAVEEWTFLHIAALDTSAVAHRFTDVNMQDALHRRRAGAFPVTVVNGSIVALDGK